YLCYTQHSLCRATYPHPVWLALWVLQNSLLKTFVHMSLFNLYNYLYFSSVRNAKLFGNRKGSIINAILFNKRTIFFRSYVDSRSLILCFPRSAFIKLISHQFLSFPKTKPAQCPLLYLAHNLHNNNPQHRAQY